MKSQIFKSAWQLVKEFGIAFSLALKIAWAEFKESKLWEAYNKFTCLTRGEASFQIMNKIKLLQNFINANKPIKIDYATCDNSGAQHYYDNGFYNAD